MRTERVAFAVALSKAQDPEWSAQLAMHVREAEMNSRIEFAGYIGKSSASPDYNKDGTVALSLFAQEERGKTDTNRNAAVEDALNNTRADWLYWFDDDTIHPKHTLATLLALQLPFVSGLVYTKSEPYLPMAYRRNVNGSYSAILRWRRGELVEVDSVGMGCALIHRSVYEQIMEGHEVFYRQNHTVVVQPKSQVIEWGGNRSIENRAGQVVVGKDGHGYFVQPVRRVKEGEFHQISGAYPFYCMEYIRTEDHFFAELAANVGIKPTVDTNVNTDHIGGRKFGRADFRQMYFVDGEEGEDVAADAVQGS